MSACGTDAQGADDNSAVYAVSIRAPGGYDVLEVRQVPGPTRGSNCPAHPNADVSGADGAMTAAYFQRPDEASLVTVDVAFCGVNYADVCIRWGLYSSAKKYQGYPITPGFEFSGTVRAVGSAAARDFAVGDSVFGVSMFGSYSTRVTVPAVQLFKPQPSTRFTLRDNACWVATFGTAWYALKQANLHPDGARSTVLVHSASGGVGSMLVQIAKARGHKVVGVVGRSTKVAYCRGIGADVVIDKSSQPLWTTAREHAASYREFRGFHAVFDANGVSTLRESYRHTLPGGKLVVYGFHSMLPKKGGILGAFQWAKLAWLWLRSPTFDPMELVPANKSVIGFNLSYLFDSVELLQACVAEGMALAARGALQPPHVTEFPLHSCSEAHQAIESGTTIGKLVLNCGETLAAAKGVGCDRLPRPAVAVPPSRLRRAVVPLVLAAAATAAAFFWRRKQQQQQQRHASILASVNVGAHS